MKMTKSLEISIGFVIFLNLCIFLKRLETFFSLDTLDRKRLETFACYELVTLLGKKENGTVQAYA